MIPASHNFVVRGSETWARSDQPWVHYGALTAWLVEHGGPGYDMYIANKGVVHVRIPDPNAAFAFRLRWT